jgi:hypothetical protein
MKLRYILAIFLLFISTIAFSGLESPGNSETTTGIGIVRGWVCDANDVSISIDGGYPKEIAYGNARGDTSDVCGDTDNGFETLVNWNNLGDGSHTVVAFADGLEIGRTTFNVVTLGLNDPYVRGLEASYTLSNFPQTGKSTIVSWSEKDQDFTITSVISNPGITNIMPDASIIAYVKTNSGINIDAAAAFKSGAVVDGYAVWETTEADTRLRKIYAVNSQGNMFAGAEGATENLLSLFTAGGIGTPGTWGYPIAEDDVTHPFLDLEVHSNSLSSSLYGVYKSFLEEGGIITSNALQLVHATPYGEAYGSIIIGFEDLSFGLLNNLDEPIEVMLSAIRMLQMQTRHSHGAPYDGTTLENDPRAALYNSLNQQWNPKQYDEQDGSGSRSFEISVNASNVYYTASADGDNGNSGYIKIDDVEVESFYNWDSDNHVYSVAGHFPSTVEMYVNNNWSMAHSYIRLAAYDGSISITNVTQSPTGGMSDNPPPLRLTINPGWNGAAPIE